MRFLLVTRFCFKTFIDIAAGFSIKAHVLGRFRDAVCFAEITMGAAYEVSTTFR